MNQPTIVPSASAQPVVQGQGANGQQTADASAQPVAQANGSVGTALIDPALRAELDLLRSQAQIQNDYIGELTARLGNTRSSEEQTEQLRTIGKQLQDAARDDENPERFVALVANVAQITQQNLHEQQRQFATAYDKIVTDNPKIKDDVSFYDLQMHVYRNNLDVSALTKPKAVSALIEEVRKATAKPIDIGAEKAKWEKEWAEKNGRATAQPRPAFQSQFPQNAKVDPSVQSLLKVRRNLW